MGENVSMKVYQISKYLVWNSYLSIKANGGSAGIDDINLKDYEANVKQNLYKLWNRMSSGSYFPKPVKLVEILKSNGGVRPLGIPTVEDRIAQMVVVKTIEDRLESIFHKDSYGYRHGKSAHNAVKTAKLRCWEYSWVLDMDISKFFDTIDHNLLMSAVEKHVTEKWILLYIKRWLSVPYQLKDGQLVERTMGVPQGSVIGPVLANLFLHYTFDKWMEINFPKVPFERYADDTICHCVSEKQAKYMFYQIKDRFEQCNLKLNEEKTKIVFCKSDIRYRGEECDNVTFDFLGFTFRPRSAVDPRTKTTFVGFLPAISKKSVKRINDTIREWTKRRQTRAKVDEIADMINPSIQGWINYYGRFYPSVLKRVLKRVNDFLFRWAKRKYKSLKSKKRAIKWICNVATRDTALFAHWRYGVVPTCTF